MKIYLHVLTSFIKDKVVYASDKHKHNVTYAGTVNKSNRPFPSSYPPPLQSEFKCKVFVMVISCTLHMNEN